MEPSQEKLNPTVCQSFHTRRANAGKERSGDDGNARRLWDPETRTQTHASVASTTTPALDLAHGCFTVPRETLPASNPVVVSIRLASLDLIFQGPDVDPFVGSFDGRSGMEHLELALKSRRSRNSPDVCAVEWVVPAVETSAERLEMTRNAIAGWCRTHEENTRSELSAMAKERRRSWLLGGLFFAACFAIAALLERSSALSGFGGYLLSETIVIAGWVGLWHPLDLTLYATWPLRTRLNLMDRLSRLEVKLASDLEIGAVGTPDGRPSGHPIVGPQ